VPPPVKSPIFLVGPPAAGTEKLFESLARAEGLWFPRPGEQPFTEGEDALDPLRSGRDSHRLTADDAEPELSDRLREAVAGSLRDREGRPAPEAAESVRALDRTPRNSLRVPFLDAVFPDAMYVYVHRDPRESLAELLGAWRSRKFVTYSRLPGWDGPPWSLVLIPGWQELAGRELPEIVARQWTTTTKIVLDDLEALPPGRWAITDYARLLDEPREELRRLCQFLGIRYDQALLSPLELARHGQAQLAEKQRNDPDPEVMGVLPQTDELAARAGEWLGEGSRSRARAAATAQGESPLRSVHTGSFPDLVARAGGSLLVSTYQTGKLIVARNDATGLNTHFRNFDKPMGMAVAPGRFALGTRTEVWDFRNMPEVAPKLEPQGTHDACFLPRNRHTTGDIAIHEIAFAQGELWAVATAFSCLATLDAQHSFVPRWKPPFISELGPGDRCHLNGLAIVDDAPKYVTALGTTDEPGAWRERKADGGVVIDVPSGEIVLSALSMPHSPRLVNGRLVFLQSGKGELCSADLQTGEIETIAELPGFTRGMEILGPVAFIGLSQIR